MGYIIVHSELTAYITLVCTSSVLNLFLFLYVFFRRHHFTNIANVFMLNMAFITIYCVASAFSLVSTTLGEIKFWTIILYMGMPFSPPMGLLFVMHYLGMKVTRKRCIALFVIPVISLILVATNDWHHLHYRVFEIDPSLGAPFIHQEIGPWYMIHGVYTFGSMFAAFLLILSRWRETAKTYRWQLISLMCGQVVPIVTAFIYLIGLTPPGVDPVPMVTWLSSLFYLWSIRNSRLFAIMPIAKDAIFNSINDGVIVLDESQRLIEFNHACEKMFPQLNKSMFGMDFTKVWVDLTGDLFPFQLDAARNNQELQLTYANHTERTYQIRTASLQQSMNRNGQLIIFTDITELKRLQIQLEHQAYYDELTQIYNRRAFFKLCNSDFAEAKKDSVAFSVVLMDVDYFKKVNDTYGHAVGDQLLVHIVQLCQTQMKKGVLFARYGGEEFVLSLKGYDLKQVEALATQICKFVEKQPLQTEDGPIYSTLSIGVAEANMETDETLYQLLNKADKALYSAKQGGRNQIQVYTGREEIYK